MSEPKREDIDKQAGWLVRVTTPPNLDRLFYVYELNWAKAKELVKAKVPVDAAETIKAVGPANIHALTGNRMKPGMCFNMDKHLKRPGDPSQLAATD
jgi:hypothetical protein